MEKNKMKAADKLVLVKCKNCGTESLVDKVAINMGFHLCMCSNCDEFKNI